MVRRKVTGPADGTRPTDRHRRGILSHAANATAIVSYGRFATSVGFFLVLPFLAVYVTRDLGMSSAQAGFLLAVLSFARRGLAIPSGAAADRFGAVRVMVGGLLLEVVAYSLFATARGFALWVFAVFLHGAGGSMNNMGTRGVLAHGDRRATASGLSGYYVMINAAALIGPLIGAFLLSHRLVGVSMAVAAGLHLAFAAVSAALLSNLTPTPGRTGESLPPAWRDRALLRYCLLTVGCWFLLSQFYLALPLTVGGQRLPVSLLGFLNAANALVVMIVVLLVRGRTSRATIAGQVDLLRWSAVVLGLCWLACIRGGSVPLVGAVVVMSVGEALFVSVVDVIAVHLAPIGRRASYLGYSSMSWAVGAGIGGLVGGGGYSLATEHRALWAYWASFAAIGCLSAIAMRYHRTALLDALRTREERTPEPATSL